MIRTTCPLGLAGVILVALGACVQSSAVLCADGATTCPPAYVCVELPAGPVTLPPAPPIAACATEDQLRACVNVRDGDACSAPAGPGTCHGSVCLSDACGNGRKDATEACDDGDTRDGSADDRGCSASCQSTEVCGNGTIDPGFGETCDDANAISRDGCASTCLDEAAGWRRRILAPPSRTGAAAAYDLHRGVIVMIGGNSTTNASVGIGTAEWDGTGWVERTPTISPGAGSGLAMAYDAERRVMVLFGGPRAETWEWDGQQWHARGGGLAPAPRSSAAMVYDLRRRRIVLFGGTLIIANAAATPINDTWEWDGATWRKIEGGPVPAAFWRPEAAYDPGRGVTVMYGQGEVWEYDGTAWAQKATTGGPSVRFGVSLNYDPATGRVLLYGGQPDGSMWAWDGTAWTAVGVPTLPPVRENHIMLPDGHGRFVMFGGTTDRDLTFVGNESANVDNVTWLYDGASWRTATAPSARRQAAAATEVRRGQVLLVGGRATAGILGDAWVLARDGWRALTTAPTARARAALACPTTTAACVLFGGDSASGVLGDTWTWDGSAWAARAVTGPPARAGAAIAYDGARDRVILFGGTDASGPLADTWAWDGATWSPVPINASPPALGDPRLGFDPVRQQLILVGDVDAQGTASGETWRLDALGWERVGPPELPRRGASLAWNAARRALVLASGDDQGVGSLEWTGTRWVPIGTTLELPRRRDGASATALDGAGTLVIGGLTDFGVTSDWWTLAWEGPLAETCRSGFDTDADGLRGCDDPDCFAVCSPGCTPGVTCTQAAPRCGDGTCGPLESCRTCPGDCACAPTCGDLLCDPGETACPGDCP